MRVALVNPRWSYAGSIYFGCREPHLPLELAYTKAALEARGHEALLLDGHLHDMAHETIATKIEQFGADISVVTTAPSYLFWRCPPPELRVPRDFLDTLGYRGGIRVAVGPHGSATPGAALAKLDADVVVRGECEEAVVELAEIGLSCSISGIAWRKEDGTLVNSAPRAAPFVGTPALRWDDDTIRRLTHHHHRFDRAPDGPGAEVEASRGCPYSCSFCAKIDYRDRYRRRQLSHVLEEIDGLVAQGVTYVYFIDEIFLPDHKLLRALTERKISFGVQTRIDLWTEEMIEALGAAGCVSIEAGVESLSTEGRDALAKRCKIDTDALTARLVHARRFVPFVQANLIATPQDDPETIRRWRERLLQDGVWANDPVPLFPYPSSPDYRRLFGEPDAHAWERAHSHYLAQFDEFSDIQEARPVPLHELEGRCAC
jgi:anaerobic magnesium-protoporphyrin IX monomethyl ester cyclase